MTLLVRSGDAKRKVNYSGGILWGFKRCKRSCMLEQVCIGLLYSPVEHMNELDCHESVSFQHTSVAAEA
jgi:hypothetical protein